MRYRRSVRTLVLATAALALFAADASAQRRHGRRRAYYGPRVGFYGGFLGPGWGFYSPFGPFGWWGGSPYAVPAGERVGVRLEIDPPETEVFVDGYFAGQVDKFDGFMQRLNVAPGQHVIELYLDGHKIVREKLYASPGATYKIHHEMLPLEEGEASPSRPRPSEPPQTPSVRAERAPRGSRPVPLATAGFGALAVRVHPKDAEVWIDGDLWPNPPGNDLVLHLSAGRHTVELRGKGYQTFSTEIDVDAGDATPLNVKLAPSN
jgi:hypothetical protein